MKKNLFLVVLMLFATCSFAADFIPTPMTITGESLLEYQFEGGELTIPFEMGGKPGAVYLVINTSGQGENITAVQNGNLGWHYVNGIDTTVYVSPRYQRDIGSQTIVWDGTNQDAEMVAAGVYDYYLWGYDDKTPRLKACDYIQIGFDWESQMTHIIETGVDGMPLDNPILFGARLWWAEFYWIGEGETECPKWAKNSSHFKWVLGGDATDLGNLQWTECAIYPQSNGGALGPYDEGFFLAGGPVLDPTDQSIFYHCSHNVSALVNTMLKWEFVSDGEAILDETWLGWDELEWEDQGAKIGSWSQNNSCYTDNNYIYVNSPGLHQKEIEWNRLRCVSFDGEPIFDKALHEWYMPEDGGPNGYINGSFHHLHASKNRPNNWLLVAHTCCMWEMIDTTRILEDEATPQADYVVFQNRNGDYFLDRAFEPDYEPAWVCLTDAEGTELRVDSATIDKNGFNIMGTSYVGLSSFAVATQDGTGIEHMHFADDVVSDNQNTNLGGQVLHSGSAYDGFYWSTAVTEEDVSIGGLGYAGQHTANHIAFDSFRGTITNESTAVEEEAIAAFAVDQNTPNPFNPTTTIGFTITEAGHVSVDIYNVAGQKVDTLVNDALSAGRHSLVWDASGMSAGVYFYTVKSGDFSKTMKMTLLK